MKQIIFLILLSYGIKLSAQQNSLPDKRPVDFTLSFHFDGGMFYHFEDITITADSCLHKLNHKGKISTTRFKLGNAGLDSLYAMLQQYQFTQIEYRSGGQVYDRGGETIVIGWDNNRQRHTVNDAQNTFVSKAWLANWKAICDYVNKLSGENKIKG